jgi:isopenicillin-N epimerase
MQFMQEHGWEYMRQKCHGLLGEALKRISDLTRLPILYPANRDCFHQMGVAELPLQPDLRAFKGRLYDEFRVEVPCIEWEGRHFLRISVQAYNDQGDIDRLLLALGALLRED